MSNAIKALESLEAMVRCYDFEPDLTPFLSDIEEVKSALNTGVKYNKLLGNIKSELWHGDLYDFFCCKGFECGCMGVRHIDLMIFNIEHTLKRGNEE